MCMTTRSSLSKSEEVPYFFYQNGELVYDARFRDSKLYRRNVLFYQTELAGGFITTCAPFSCFIRCN